MVLTHSVYLSTLTTTGQYVPLDKTNLANVSFNVNWRDVFSRDVEGKAMRVKCKVISRNVVAASAGWNTSIGTIRCNLPDKNSNSTNGLILSLLEWTDNPTTGSGNHIIYSSTLDTNGVESFVPFGVQQFKIQFLDMTETQLANSNMADWNILMVFEIDE